MADTVAPKRRSEIMSNIRAKGMKPEMLVRRLTHSMSYRYRLHRKDLPGKPDLFFPGWRKVVFVHGCFWHQHTSAACKIARVPRSNRDYLLPKLQRNAARDPEHLAKVDELRWEALAIWECELKDASGVGERIRDFLDRERSVQFRLLNEQPETLRPSGREG